MVAANARRSLPSTRARLVASECSNAAAFSARLGKSLRSEPRGLRTRYRRLQKSIVADSCFATESALPASRAICRSERSIAGVDTVLLCLASMI